ncbi:uncharacterized protein LOC134215095 [Armigeres subalbatus]|uniref:uncharacterized protein LOC134215095 n=1 Tax=Armigeres subalbatus TaxID=124917 RepID=UPI002ED4B4AE
MDKSQIKHLLDLSKEEKKAFLNSFDGIMSDCDGVVWNFTGPIPGVDDALQLLKKDGKKLSFISNNGMRTMEEYRQKFQKLGVESQEYDIVHPGLTTVKYLKSIDMQDAVYCIGAGVFKDYLRSAGFTVLDGPTERIPDDDTAKALRSFAGFFASTNEPRVGAVVVDIDVNVSLTQLMKAKCYLDRNPDCLLLAGATDYIIPLGEKMDVIGPGYFIDLLENVTGRKALVLGKPGHALSEFILEQFHVTHPERTLFIGDMLPQDIGFGTLCGFQKLLMLSGGTSKAMMLAHNKPEELPNYYADSFADFVQLYKDVAEL